MRDDPYQVSGLMINVLCGLIWDRSQENLAEGGVPRKGKMKALSGLA